jgi:hypothetical protein
MRKFLVLPLLGLGLVGCMSDGGYYDNPPPRSGYYGSSPGGYYPQSSGWGDDGGQCTFQTRRGPVAGYKPSGKNRCCVETRYGPSCQ